MEEAEAIIANLTPFRVQVRTPDGFTNWVTWQHVVKLSRIFKRSRAVC